MERIVTILASAMVYSLVRGRAIHNTISLRLNPIFVNEDEDISAFERIPHDRPLPPDFGKEFSRPYMNQVPRVMFPDKPSNGSNLGESNQQFLKIPIISQPFSDYKIIVATAPWNMKISGSEAKPVVIYFVFPEDDSEPSSIKIPEIYFVRRGAEPKTIRKKDKIDPLIIVDSNRTVTGLKSKTVSKFIKFKNKYT